MESQQNIAYYVYLLPNGKRTERRTLRLVPDGKRAQQRIVRHAAMRGMRGHRALHDNADCDVPVSHARKRVIQMQVGGRKSL